MEIRKFSSRWRDLWLAVVFALVGFVPVGIFDRLAEDAEFVGFSQPILWAFETAKYVFLIALAFVIGTLLYKTIREQFFS